MFGIASAMAVWGLWFVMCVILAIFGNSDPLEKVEYGFGVAIPVGILVSCLIKE